MMWLDVAGPPGSGKSTLSYPIWQDRSVTGDGKPCPFYWKPYLDQLEHLTRLVQDHPSIEAVLRMNDRTLKKMAAVERMEAPRGRPVFIQTGFLQRILGFGWRLVDLGRDPYLIARALWLMPVSVGVVFLEASSECLKARNRRRRDNPQTAHEDRSFQVDLMLPAIAIAKETLRERGVPVLCLDVERQSIEAARAELLDFAGFPAGDAQALRPGGEVAAVPAL